MFVDKQGWQYHVSFSVQRWNLQLGQDISNSPPGFAQLTYTLTGTPTRSLLISDNNPGRTGVSQISVSADAIFSNGKPINVASANQPVANDPTSGSDQNITYDAGNHGLNDLCTLDSDYDATAELISLNRFSCSAELGGSMVESYRTYPQADVTALIDNQPYVLSKIRVAMSNSSASEICSFDLRVVNHVIASSATENSCNSAVSALQVRQ